MTLHGNLYGNSRLTIHIEDDVYKKNDFLYMLPKQDGMP